jgi:hypothetical protein
MHGYFLTNSSRVSRSGAYSRPHLGRADQAHNVERLRQWNGARPLAEHSVDKQTDNSIVAPELTLRGISHARRRKAKNMSSNGVRTATKDVERLVLTISRYLNTDVPNRSTSTTRSPLTAATCHSDTIGAWLRILTFGVTAGCEIPWQAGPLTKSPGLDRAKLELHNQGRRPCPRRSQLVIVRVGSRGAWPPMVTACAKIRRSGRRS